MENLLIEDRSQWTEILAAHHGHLLQSWAWGELKRRFGWTPCRLQVGGAAAQILFRHLPLGRSVGYIPRGPLLDWRSREQRQALFSAIHAESKKRNAIFLKIEPDIWNVCDPDEDHIDSEDIEQAQDLSEFLEGSDFIPADTIQPQSSIMVDLSLDEAAVLAGMKQKTRYNIRLAERKGIRVREGHEADLQIFYQLARLTAARDGFDVHSLAYYEQAHRLFYPDQSVLLIAEYQDEPLAALMAFRQGEDAYYFYGASSNSHRNLMAPYLIQWAAMRWARKQGCTRYDLWGIPDAGVSTLEAEFVRRSEGLWGVYRFKRGFGGKVIRTAGAFDRVYMPSLYKLYQFRRNGNSSLNQWLKFFRSSFSS